MKTSIAVLLMVLLGACASTPGMDDSARLANYRAHAGNPVSAFRFFGQLNSWESLDGSNIAVWTHPHEAWLLELSGPCQGIEYATRIGLTSQGGRVYSGFDNVLVDDHAAIDFPCRIHAIRPLDVRAIKQVEQAARAQASSGT
jgi:hypothetical protein